MTAHIFHNLTKEEHNFALGFGMANANEDELVDRVARMLLIGSESVKPKLKKMMIVFNVLKKLWEENDNDGFHKFLRLFLMTHRRELVSIIVTSTLSVDLSASMEKAETVDQPEQHYLESVNHFKFLYDLRKEVRMENPIY